MRIYILLALFLIQSGIFAQVPYKNANLPIEDRVEDLLSRMTQEEKFWQCFMVPGDLSIGKEKLKYGIFGFQVHTKGKENQTEHQILNYSEGGTAYETAQLINEIQKYFIEETRLGIPIIAFDEGLHGLVRKGATSFPQSIALAATWDTSMVKEVAHAIANEFNARGIRQILSPVLNIARDVRWGRTEETYGEDPYLVSQMAVAFISEFEKMGIITTPKHFIANVGDGGRDSYPIHFNERLLEEIYFPAFKAVFKKAGAQSVMTSYNSLNGNACSANDWLLNKKLKQEWGFDGFVISDANAVGGANVLHYTSKNYSESGKNSIENGLDVIFQTDYEHYKLFYPAFQNKEIDEEKLNEAVRRVLRAKFKLGLFENPYVIFDEDDYKQLQESNKKTVRDASKKSIVLLKNENQTLPLSKDIKTVAVIGTDAIEARLGGYSGPGRELISILEGIKNKLAKHCDLKYSEGCGRDSEELRVVKAQYLSTDKGGHEVQGLRGAYFNNIKMEGQPDLTRIDSEIDFRWTLYSPEHNTINYDYYSARWTGRIKAPKSGNINIGIKGNDGYRLYIDHQLIIDNWRKQSFGTKTNSFYFEKDKLYDIKIEFYETVGNVWFKLIWDAEIEASYHQKIKDAVDMAEQSELAIVVVGIEEGEGHDRALLNLPGHQEEMIKAISSTGTPMVVVLVGGSAINMSNWINNVPAIIDVWYPGEQGGNAIADVLWGDYNPAGRLPITFPMHEGQLPLYYNHKPTGRNDDYINLTGKPLFPFGYGLSYTSFEYSDIQLEKSEILSNETVNVSCTITNLGDFDGEEVVQLYIKDVYASVARPILELKAFTRILIEKGERKTITFRIEPEMLSLLDKDLQRLVEAGEFRIMIGASSNDIRLRTHLNVKSE